MGLSASPEKMLFSPSFYKQRFFSFKFAAYRHIYDFVAIRQCHAKIKCNLPNSSGYV